MVLRSKAQYGYFLLVYYTAWFTTICRIINQFKWCQFKIKLSFPLIAYLHRYLREQTYFGLVLLLFYSSACVFQAGWKENHATFMCELKNLQASGLTTLGHALRTAFDLLNLNRLVSGIDNYGQVCDSNALSCMSLTTVWCNIMTRLGSRSVILKNCMF